MTTLADLLVDLDAEYDDLRAVVGGLADTAPEWDLPTPAEGWAVRDQISHLAYFDDADRVAKRGKRPRQCAKDVGQPAGLSPGTGFR